MSTQGPHSLSPNTPTSIKRVLVSAGLIRAPKGHSQEGKILMTRRLADAHLAHAWEFPGGKVEIGEDPIDALHRELREELAIEVNRVEIFSVGHHLYDLTKSKGMPQAKDVVLMVYECYISAGEPQALGVSDYSWLSPAQVCNLPLPPADEEVITRLRRELDGNDHE